MSSSRIIFGIAASEMLKAGWEMPKLKAFVFQARQLLEPNCCARILLDGLYADKGSLNHFWHKAGTFAGIR